MKTSFKSTVMQRAHYLFRTLNKAWSVCLKKAWALYKLNKEMKSHEVSFYFEKSDGTVRKAVGSLTNTYEKKTDKTPNPFVFTYFDSEKNAYRCFKIENFLMIENLAKIAA
ncbi:SH3 beta-barrel fold-containing protein [Soonwooa sp.]|uniref:SH3 beta-barrel fold-containing protein n=1 Tax=Soonwooa sp. TaxID=1938592 RepID=UPI0028AA00EA|nr:SH3 beta-barrel fold-containing protein [Soonwooa sp.]